jgi:hypothetical protein
LVGGEVEILLGECCHVGGERSSDFVVPWM